MPRNPINNRDNSKSCSSIPSTLTHLLDSREFWYPHPSSFATCNTYSFSLGPAPLTLAFHGSGISDNLEFLLQLRLPHHNSIHWLRVLSKMTPNLPMMTGLSRSPWLFYSVQDVCPCTKATLIHFRTSKVRNGATHKPTQNRYPSLRCILQESIIVSNWWSWPSQPLVDIHLVNPFLITK